MQRSWSFTWELDDEVWTTLVEPVIAALRALPDQDRRRPQLGYRALSVLELPG